MFESRGEYFISCFFLADTPVATEKEERKSYNEIKKLNNINQNYLRF